MSAITVRFIGPVRRPGPERSLELGRDGLATLADLLRSLGYRPDEMSALTVLADGARLALEAPLDGVQAVEILLAIGGG